MLHPPTCNKSDLEGRVAFARAWNRTELQEITSPRREARARRCVRESACSCMSPRDSHDRVAAADFDVNAHDAHLRRQYSTLRFVLLTATCMQSTADVLLRSFSRRTLRETYTPASVLLIAELLKLVVSLTMVDNLSSSRLAYLLRTSLP